MPKESKHNKAIVFVWNLKPRQWLGQFASISAIVVFFMLTISACSFVKSDAANIQSGRSLYKLSNEPDNRVKHGVNVRLRLQGSTTAKYASKSAAARATIDELSRFNFIAAEKEAVGCYAKSSKAQPRVAAFCAGAAAAAAFAINDYTSVHIWSKRGCALICDNPPPDLQDMALLLKQSVNEAAASTCPSCGDHKGAQFMLNDAFDIKLHDKNIMGHTLPAFFVHRDQERYEFFADTAAPTVVDSVTAKEMDAIETGATLSIQTLGTDAATMKYAHLPIFAIADMQLMQWPAIVSSSDMLKGQNIIGLDFWSRFDTVTFDYVNMRIHINNTNSSSMRTCVPMSYRFIPEMARGIVAIPVTVDNMQTWAVPDIGNNIGALASTSLYHAIQSRFDESRKTSGKLIAVHIGVGGVSRATDVGVSSIDIGDRGIILPRQMFAIWSFDFKNRRLCVDPWPSKAGPPQTPRGATGALSRFVWNSVIWPSGRLALSKGFLAGV